MTRSAPVKKLVIIENCTRGCPFVKVVATEGAGCAEDYFCTKAKKVKGEYRKIAGYIEWPSELPKDGEFPKWCPLYTAEEGMYTK